MKSTTTNAAAVKAMNHVIRNEPRRLKLSAGQRSAILAKKASKRSK